MGTLLPATVLEDCVELHLARTEVGGRSIYLAMLGCLAAGLVALPLVSVPVSVHARGVLTPVVERQEILAPAAGVVAHVRARDNLAVRRGDTLLALDAAAGEERRRSLRERVEAARLEVADLEALLSATEASAAARDGPATNAGPGLGSLAGSGRSAAVRLRTPRYAQALAELRTALGESALDVERARGELARARRLAALQLLPPAELEARTLDLAQAKARARAVLDRYRSGWAADLADRRSTLRDLAATLSDADQAAKLSVVLATADGTVQEWTGVAPGSFVAAGERLGVLSPDGALEAELLVPSRDIGLLRPGLPVRLLVDAFDYRDWGALHGRIREVSADAVVVDGRPLFRVRCTLAGGRLRLGNGAVARLQRGMTLDGRFILARRTLLQLLRDRATDWIAPRSGATDADGNAAPAPAGGEGAGAARP